MCGILGYIGKRNGVPIVYEGLQHLSYRGYDSWGIAAHTNNGIFVEKQVGDISNAQINSFESTLAIGHTRWATHGGVTQGNAHPHTNMDGTIAVVHNGIIENYQELRDELRSKGYIFKSATDTEVVPHLVDYYIKQGNDFKTAFTLTTRKLEGHYALLATKQNDSRILFARNGSPLLVGIGNGEYFISSDIPSFLSHTKQVIQLEDGDIGEVSHCLTISHENVEVTREPLTISWDVDVAKKGDFAHFMLKEIHDQIHTIRAALNQDEKIIEKTKNTLRNASTIYLVGCGTSYNAGATSTYQFTAQGMKAQAILASEFDSTFVNETTPIIAISQSGETADLLDAVKIAKQKGAPIISIVNVVTSTIARISDIVIPLNSGPELAVASTKACTSQLVVLNLLAGMDAAQIEEAAKQAKQLIQQTEPQMKKLALSLQNTKNLFVLGRGALAQTAREAALKIKEVSYIHAEGMNAGELKHGTIALIEQGTPVIVISDDKTRMLTLSNAQEVKARGAFVIGIDSEPNAVYDVHVKLPDIKEGTSLLSLLPLQIFAYYLAVGKGLNPDKPRNLAKSVTVR
jgi:glucosamine--fructose-6-phosphate aminotransferase (isomerizing)